jgi:Tfp pilus assembly protein PilF
MGDLDKLLPICLGLVLLSACTSTPDMAWHPCEAVDQEGARVYEKALAKKEQGKLDEALVDLEELIHGFPEFFRAHRAVQDILIEQEGVQAARTRAEQNLAASRDALNLTLKARVEKNTEEKLKTLREALKKDESYIWAHYGIAFLILQDGRVSEYDRAREHLEKAVGYCSEFTEAHKLLIETLHLLGEPELEAEQYETYLDMIPGDLEVRYNYADLLRTKLDDPEEAVEQLDYILEREPLRLDALFLKGVALCQNDELSAAETLFHQLKDRHPDALLNLAFLYKDYMGEPDRALDYFKRYLDYAGPNADDKAYFDEEILVPKYIELLEGEAR